MEKEAKSTLDTESPQDGERSGDEEAPVEQHGLGTVISNLLHQVQVDRARTDKVPVGKYRCEHCSVVHGWDDPPCRPEVPLEQLEAVRIRQDLRGFLDKAYLTIPTGMDWCRVSNPQWNQRCSSEAKEFVRKWKREAGSAVLSGETGVGKTIAAVALLHRILDAARDRGPDEVSNKMLRWSAGAAFVSGPTLALARRQHSLGEEAPLVELATRASLLVLDEIGHEYFAPEKDTTLFEVLDSRYLSRKPTIITTELNQDQLMKRYRPSLFRRIWDIGNHIVCSSPKRTQQTAK